MRGYITVCAILLSVLTASGQKVEGGPTQIVDHFYPQKMLDLKSAQNVGSRRECFAVYDRLTDGTPKTIMAGYGSGFDGAIAVIQLQPSGNYQVVYEPSGLAMDGASCSVKVVDVTGDGVPEVWYRFGGQRGDGNWVFKWDGTQLTNIGPTAENSRVGTWSNISNGSLVDLYHDGTLQIYSSEWQWSANDLIGGPDYLYRYSNGSFHPDMAALMHSVFYGSQGKTEQETEDFEPTNRSTGPYLLKITNGDLGGANRVSRAHILVNGKEIFGPNDFNSQIEFLTATLTNVQRGDNTLSVELDSDPGSHLTVIVQDLTPALQNAP